MISPEVLMNINLLGFNIENGEGTYNLYLNALIEAMQQKSNRNSIRMKFIQAEVALHPITRVRFKRPESRVYNMHRVITLIAYENLDLAKDIINGKSRLTHDMVTRILKTRSISSKTIIEIYQEACQIKDSPQRILDIRHFNPSRSVKDEKAVNPSAIAMILVASLNAMCESLSREDPEILRKASWESRRLVMHALTQLQKRINTIKEMIA